MANEPLKKGTPVRLVQPVIQGEVLRVETDGERFGYRVAYRGADGERHERFFGADQIEAVAAKEAQP